MPLRRVWRLLFPMNFDELKLAPAILKAVHEHGYDTPTPIQAQAIPAVLEGHDLLGGAQTGTGKTAAFTLPMLHKLSMGASATNKFGGIGIRALVLTPTRELAAQVEESVRTYGKYLELDSTVIFGGVGMNPQISKLKKGVDILVATPGRLLDLQQQGMLDLSQVQMLILDEADRMLDMGFIHDVKKILALVPREKQSLLFSATMPPEIQKLADRFLQNPTRIEVAKPSSTAKTVTQRIVAAHNKDYEKRAVLRDLVRAEEAELKNAIIFCNRKKDVADLFRSLDRHGFSVGALHGDMDQRSRTTMLQNFRDGNLSLLVASDVAARGLDIPDVSHVFNFDVPIHAEDYVHRIGRTGRAGRSGKAFTLVTKSDAKYLDAIEKLIAEKIEWLSGDLSSLPAPMESFESNSSRRGPKERGGRGRDRNRRDAPASPVENINQDAQSAVDTDIAAHGEDKVKAERRPEKTPRNSERNSRNQPHANDDNRDRRRHYRDHDDGPTPVGFGDDIPAFMLIVANAKA